MNLYWPYLAPLLVVVLLTLATRVPTMVRAALVLILNYAVNTAFVLSTEVYDPWLFFILMDAVSAYIILVPPSGKIQAIIGGLLCTQVVVHFLYGVSKFFNPAHVSIDAYLQIIDILGYLQMALLGVWGGGHWIAVAHRTWRRWRAHPAGPPNPEGLP